MIRPWMRKAHLFNYPGIGSMDRTNYLETLRDQVGEFGVVEVDVTMETSVGNAHSTGARVRAEE